MTATAPSQSRLRSWLLGLLLLALVVAGVVLLRSRIHFDWRALARELRSVSLLHVLGGVAIIYGSLWLRAWRWAVLVGETRPTRPSELFGTQLIGFTAVTLVGRLADLVRPYLTSKRLSLSVGSQLAVYSVERAFDLGAAAILFSFTLAVAPSTLPHHAAYVRAGLLSLGATVAISLFAVALRFAGQRIADLCRRLLRPLGANFAERAGERILDFRNGLHTVSNGREFITAATMSIAMWAAIAFAYVLSARAFTQNATLAHLSFTAVMLLLATSVSSSLVQLPVVGWFTQVGLVAAAIHGFFAVPLETATACAAVIFFVLSFCVVPGGLAAAQIQGISLRQAVSASKSGEPQVDGE